MENIEVVKRAHLAKEILENPLIKEFFKETKEELFRQWQDTERGEIKKRETIYQLNFLLGNFESYFKVCIGKGKYELKLQEKNLIEKTIDKLRGGKENG